MFYLTAVAIRLDLPDGVLFWNLLFYGPASSRAVFKGAFYFASGLSSRWSMISRFLL